MKKMSLLKQCSYLFFIALLGACNSGHYAHLNKIQRDAAKANEQATKEILNQDKTESIALKNTVENQITENGNCKEQDLSTNPAKEQKAVVHHKSKSNLLSNALASKIAKNLPNKINSIFSEKKNITNHNNKTERSNLLYYIIVALVILFILGLLGGPGLGFGNLIYIILVIALVLLLLRLLGIA